MSTTITSQSNFGSTSLSKAAALKSKLPSTEPHVPTTNSIVKSKKDTPKASTSKEFIAPAKTQHQVKRRVSKPMLIDWFRNKLSGTTVRTRRASDALRYGASSTRGKDKHRRTSVPPPPPPPPLAVRWSRTRSNTQIRPHSHRGTISLNESDGLNEVNDDVGSHSIRSVSDDGGAVRYSLYSPTSYFEADDDASVRPLPPSSSPPSPSPSRPDSSRADSSRADSASYISQPRTFMSLAASTKPTTVLSVDLTGGGMAHIAQAPLTPTVPAYTTPSHIRAHSSGPSSGSITFSSIPPHSPITASRPSSGNSGAAGARGATLLAPLYTTHHPRNNPRPSSPPPDDASVLTLASSAFAIPGARIGVTALTMSGHGSVVDDSVSQWSNAAGLTDSTSQLGIGDLEEGMDEGRYYQDVDASVRALRPRSSRRGSWDSTTSGWSANVGGYTGTPSPGAKTKSVWTSGSLTGGFSTVEDGYDDGDEGCRDDLSEKDATANLTMARESSVQSSAMTVEPPSSATEGEVQTPPMPAPANLASTMTLAGSKKDVPTAMASTIVLPGSKAVSQVPSPAPGSTEEGDSGASTPTKTEAKVALAELNAKVDSLKSEEEKVREEKEAEAVPFSAATTIPSEYQSAPSSPAAH